MKGIVEIKGVKEEIEWFLGGFKDSIYWSKELGKKTCPLFMPGRHLLPGVGAG